MSEAPGARPRIVVVFTGGTISMLRDPVTGAAVPSLDGAGILARTPGLDGVAAVEAIDWGLVPASHLSFAQLLDIARLLEAQLARTDVDGAVVVQGTDTLEETAFAWDLLLAPGKPVAVVGAMRSAGDAGYEGGANLRDAVRAAACAELAGEGVVVVMGGDVLPAHDVAKLHTDRYEAFGAPNFGSLGRVTDAGVLVTRARRPRPLVRPWPRAEAVHALRVELLTATVATDGELLRAAVRLGARGIVVAATGSGNTHPDVLEAAREAMAGGVTVVHASRCPAGSVSAGYGFPGGSAQWAASGALQARFLSGPKARVALALGLAAGLDREALAATLGA